LLDGVDIGVAKIKAHIRKHKENQIIRVEARREKRFGEQLRTAGLRRFELDDGSRALEAAALTRRLWIDYAIPRNGSDRGRDRMTSR
jgi:hypothetical protein